MAWVFAAKAEEIPDRAGRSIDLGTVRIALFRKGKSFYALRDQCPHRGGPLGEGQLTGDLVMCPWHAWEFNIKSGACEGMKGVKQDTFPTKLDRGEVFVNLA